MSLKVSKPSNSFVLFNHWDTAEESEDASRVKIVKQEHCEKVKEILVERLKVMDEETAEKRTFFVSAREAFENCRPQQREDSRRHSEQPGEQGMQDLYTVAPVYATVYNGMCSNIPNKQCWPSPFMYDV